MQVRCVKCDTLRSDKYMERAGFVDRLGVFEAVDVYRCLSKETCRANRKLCPKCLHRKINHVVVKNWFGGRENVRACTQNMGMGDPCGCEHYNKEN